MPPSESEILAARLARMNGLLDSLERICPRSTDHQQLFHTLRAEVKAARDALKNAPGSTQGA